MGKFEITAIAVVAVFAGLWFGMSGKSDSAVSTGASGVQSLNASTYESRVLHGDGVAIVQFTADW